MNIILIGPQGCGKGTQAEKIAKHYDMRHFSTGDAFRAEVASGSLLGKKLQRIMDAGELVPVDTVNAVVESAITTAEGKGLIFDGYPRTDEQASFLEKNTNIDAVIVIDISDEEAVKRISSRYVCTKCGKGYNVITLPPKNKGTCDDDQAPLVQRDDDKPEAVRKRLTDYHTKTAPIIAYFKARGVPVHLINGDRPIDEVFKSVVKALG